MSALIHTLYVVNFMPCVMIGGCSRGNSFPKDTCCSSSYHYNGGRNVLSMFMTSSPHLVSGGFILELEEEHRGAVLGVLPAPPPGYGGRDPKCPFGER